MMATLIYAHNSVGGEIMLCDQCKIHQATFTLTQVFETAKTRRHLCTTCAEAVDFTPTAAVLSGKMWQYMKADPLLDVVAEDSRYALDAYYFVTECLEKAYFTQMRLLNAEPVHSSCADVLQTLRVYALDRFGVTARSTLNSWGVSTCEDFGEIIFNLIECGLLRAAPEDSKDEFQGGYDFHAAFPESPP
ncbi:MAG TPA: Minf_1886 family protein [Verrucomicrobiae bacterium]|nr:Minf_1886 family protein [Verrucomicrobiae bacterium]